MGGLLPVGRAGAVSQDAPSFEQAFEIFLAVVLEFDLPALAAGDDRDVSAELLLQLGLPFGEAVRARRGPPRVLAPQLATDIGLGTPHRESLELHVARGTDLIGCGVE